MKEYTAYFLQIDSILGQAIKDITDLFEEHNTSEIHLKTPVKLNFKPRFAGDEYKTREIGTINYGQGLIALCTEFETYYLYDLADKKDIAFIYDIVYQYFYLNNHD